MIGIGGSGMIGVATILQKRGFKVTGSDLVITDELKELKKLGAKVQIGHEPRLVQKADLVVASSAISKKNPELSYAKKSGLTIIPRAEMLGTLMKPYRSIAIAGSHGKTSTTSIIASIFNAANLSPTYVVGGQVLSVGRSSNLGDGDYIIVEADESDGSFLHLQPDISVITNIDNDHLSFYELNQEKLNQSFVSFAENLPFYGYILLNLDDSNIRKISKDIHRRQITFGFHSKNRFQITDVKLEHGLQNFQLIDHANKKHYKFSTNLSGRHNLYNVTAAICVAIEENISVKDIAKGLAGFRGVGRRFELSEIYFSKHPHVLIDDYGHHPTEIKATTKALKENTSGKLIVIFQPHRFTRTRDNFEGLKNSFENSDLTLITDIYSAGEKPIPGVSRLMFEGDDITYIKAPRLVPHYVKNNIEPGDTVLTIGAGDITLLGPQILKYLNENK